MKRHGRNRRDLESGCVDLISFSVKALVRKGNASRKARKYPPAVGMRLSVKYEGDACRNVSVMPGHRHTYIHTYIQTDRQTVSHILD